MEKSDAPHRLRTSAVREVEAVTDSSRVVFWHLAKGPLAALPKTVVARTPSEVHPNGFACHVRRYAGLGGLLCLSVLRMEACCIGREFGWLSV